MYHKSNFWAWCRHSNKKATGQNFRLVLLTMLYKVITINIAHETLKSDHSNERWWTEFSCGLCVTEHLKKALLHVMHVQCNTAMEIIWIMMLTSCVYQPVQTAAVLEFSWWFVRYTVPHPLVMAQVWNPLWLDELNRRLHESVLQLHGPTAHQKDCPLFNRIHWPDVRCYGGDLGYLGLLTWSSKVYIPHLSLSNDKLRMFQFKGTGYTCIWPCTMLVRFRKCS